MGALWGATTTIWYWGEIVWYYVWVGGVAVLAWYSTDGSGGDDGTLPPPPPSSCYECVVDGGSGGGGGGGW